MELFIEENIYQGSKSFYIFLEEGRERFVIGYKDGELVKQVYDNLSPQADLQPLLKLDRNLADSFIKQVALYASKKGINTEREDTIKGKLEATEKHLNSTQANFDKLLTAFIESK